MGEVLIRSDEVRRASDALKRINYNMHDTVEGLLTIGKSLEANWAGIAGNGVFQELRSVCINIEGERKKVMDNYAAFLLNSVAYDYETTEEKNISLADSFK